MANVKRPPFFVTPAGPEPTTGGNLSRRSPAPRGAIASGKWLEGMLTVVLPMCPFIVGLQM